MTEHNAIETIVAESYRTRIDAEDLRREVKAELNSAIGEYNLSFHVSRDNFDDGYIEGLKYVLNLIDEKEKGR